MVMLSQPVMYIPFTVELIRELSMVPLLTSSRYIAWASPVPSLVELTCTSRMTKEAVVCMMLIPSQAKLLISQPEMMYGHSDEPVPFTTPSPSVNPLFPLMIIGSSSAQPADGAVETRRMNTPEPMRTEANRAALIFWAWEAMEAPLVLGRGASIETFLSIIGLVPAFMTRIPPASGLRLRQQSQDLDGVRAL